METATRHSMAFALGHSSKFGILLWLVVLGAGCDIIDPSNRELCTEMVSVTVSDDTVPTISWDPSCEVQELNVYREGEVIVWELEGDPSFDSPVHYGREKGGARQTVQAAPLEEGTTYLVQLFIAQQTTLARVGSATFAGKGP